VVDYTPSNITVDNNFTASNGTHGLVVVNSTQQNAPCTVPVTVGNSETLQAVSPQTDNQGYQVIWHTGATNTSSWKSAGIVRSNNQTYSFTVAQADLGNAFIANLRKVCNVTVQNSFVGLSNQGVIIINGDTVDVSTITPVVEGNNISICAPTQVRNYIQYTFDHWYDGNTQNPRTFTITSHLNLIAYYTGKPLAVTNMRYLNVSAGNKIKIAWDEQPNNNVSKYYIYLKGKDSNTGEKWGPDLRATLNRGTLSYTDPIYAYTDGYTMFLLQYDVRPYYSVEQSYADSNYSAIFGGFPRGLPKAIDDGKDKQIVSNGNITPKDFDLFQNYPNPFNPTTQISYSLKENGFVTIKVYDILGKVVATLVNEIKPAGVYTVDFDASTLSSGIYFYTIKTNKFFDKKKMILMK